MPKAHVTAAQTGAKCPLRAIISSASSKREIGVFIACEKAESAVAASDGVASEPRARSHSVRRARPCATLALLATGQSVQASSSVSRVWRSGGLVYAAMRYGRVLVARDVKVKERKWWKRSTPGALPGVVGWWAR